MRNPIVHFEIPATDPKTLIDFYRKVFDWRIEPSAGAEYWTIRTVDDSTPGVNGGLLRKVGPNHRPIVYVQVESIDHQLERIVARGGRVEQPKQPMPAVGWYAIAVDPEGNSIGIFQRDPEASAQA